MTGIGGEVKTIRPVHRVVFAWAALGYPVALGLWETISGGGVWRADSVGFLFPLILATILGPFLTLKRPENRIGSVISMLAVGLVTSGVFADFAAAAYQVGDLDAAAVGWIVSELGFMLFFVATMILLPLWFPTGDAPSPRWRWIARVAVVFVSLGAVFSVFTQVVTVESDDIGVVEVSNPLGWLANDYTDLLVLPVLITAIGAIAALVFRWRRAEGVERLQMKWFGWSAGLVVLAFVLSSEPLGFPTWIVNIGWIVSVSAVLVSVGIAVMKHRLYDIDRIVSRTVSYSIVVVIIGSAFFGLVSLIASVLPSQDSLAVAASTLAVAAVFNPLRVWIQRLVDRRFNRAGYQIEVVSQEFASKLREPLSSHEIVGLWSRTVDEAIQRKAAGIWIKGIQAPHTDDTP